MTVSVQTPYNSSTGNGVTTVFPYTFQVLSTDDLKVTVDGVLQAISTHYSVSGVGSAGGGSVTFVSPPANGTVVVRYSDTVIKRETDYQANGDLRESTLDRDFDRTWLAIRDVSTRSGNAVRATPDEPLSFLPAAGDRASKLLGFDGDGDVAMYAPADLTPGVVSAFAVTYLDDTTAAATRETLAVYDSALENFVVNGAWDEWFSKPLSGVINSPSPGAGFTENQMPDNWYGGPGLPSGTFSFQTVKFAAGQTDVAGNPRQFGRFTWTGAVGAGWNEYSVARNTHLEQLSNEEPEFLAGQTWVVSFDARKGSGTSFSQIVPILWLSMGQINWLTGQNKTTGDYVTNTDTNGFVALYQATSTGVTGATPPTHTSGTVSDGTVSWAYIGKAKGRAYDLFEGGVGASTGTVHAATGTPGAGAAVTLTTSWQRFSVVITVPNIGFQNAVDYAGSGDTPRTLLGPEDNVSSGGSLPYAGFGVDVIGLPTGGDVLDLANIKVQRGTIATPYRNPQRRLRHILASNPAYWLTHEAIVNRTLARSMNTVTVANTTTDTTVFSFNLPANLLTVNRAVILESLCDVLQNNSATLTITAFLGSTSLAGGLAIAFPNSATRRLMTIRVEVQANGATNAQVGIVRVGYSAPDSASTPGAAAAETTVIGMNNAVAENALVVTPITLKFQWSSASANSSARQHTAVLRIT